MGEERQSGDDILQITRRTYEHLLTMESANARLVEACQNAMTILNPRRLKLITSKHRDGLQSQENDELELLQAVARTLVNGIAPTPDHGELEAELRAALQPHTGETHG